MIRKATEDDAWRCTYLAEEFFNSYLSAHGIPMRREDVRATALMYIRSGNVLVIERAGKVVGVAAWVITNHPANSNVTIFYETIWCIKSGVSSDITAMLHALECEAKRAKADIIIMANLGDDAEKRIGKIYIKRGFEFLETHYAKRIRRE